MSKHDIAQLEPSKLWEIFAKICQVPHPSKHEEKIVAFYEQFAQTHHLSYQKDAVGNLLIQKPATPGMENRKKVILQGHVDMVPQKDKSSTHNFETDPIELRIQGEWVTANHTTLGADNGIGVAAALAVLVANDIEHGPLEALLTVDEEVGMSGVNALSPEWLTGDILLNLDTEGEGEFYIGCAGGMNTDFVVSFQTEKMPEKHRVFSINMEGLTGGHSGVDIHLNRANAIKLIAELLSKLSVDVKVISINGGSIQHNAIPRDAEAMIAIPEEQHKKFEEELQTLVQEYVKQYQETDPRLSITATQTEAANQVICLEDQQKLINALVKAPNGVIKMCDAIPDLVETSTNLAYIKTAGEQIEVYSSQRSSVESEKERVATQLKNLFEEIGAEVKQFARYPGWNPDVNSEILATARKTYQNLFGKEPEVKAIHAGLECGLIGSKYSKLDMISFGPTIRQAHSPEERVEIASVKKFWDFVVGLLREIPVVS